MKHRRFGPLLIGTMPPHWLLLIQFGRRPNGSVRWQVSVNTYPRRKSFSERNGLPSAHRWRSARVGRYYINFMRPTP